MARPALVTVSALLACLPAAARASRGKPRAGIVSNVKVLSDKVEDVSSLEAWKRSFIREGMSDREKALAVWSTVVRFQHQDAPPSEYLQLENSVQDPVKLFNVYGYSLCSVASAHVQALARYAGLEARGWTINRHVVSEVRWDGSWHLLDSSLINYFPKADGDIAGVEEIVAGVKGWLAANPGLKGNNDKLMAFMRGGGWKKGPDILARCPFYGPNGWLPAATHGWYSTMQEYDGSTLFPYECGYSVGYRVNVQLRRGERLTRNWSNRGLHIMQGEGGEPAALKGVPGQGAFRYTPAYGDLAPGRIGNGTLEYDVPLADGGFRLGALVADNLACRAEAGPGPAVRVGDAGAEGTLVIRMPSSYVYLGGTLAFRAVVGGGGRVVVSLSDNNGLGWKEIASVADSGEGRVALKPLVFRRYDYRLRFALHGKGTGLESLKIAHDIQHSQRALPALAQGTNTITFSAEPPEGTITVEGTTEPKNRGKQLHYTDFHPERKGIGDGLLRLTGGSGEVTFPVETPGDIVRVRVGVYYRARDKRDAWDVGVSFDGGRSYKPIGRCEGPTRNHGRYFVLTDVPRGKRSAKVRFVGTQRNTTMIYQTRIDADYAEPRGGFLPVRITYVWREGAAEKRHVHVARSPRETYRITCGSRPVMKSLVLELAE